MRTSGARLDEVIHPMHKALVLVEALATEGVDAAGALEGSGLRECDLVNPAARMSARQLLTVCRNAMNRTSDPVFAIRAGRRVHATHLGFFGFALICSETPRAALDCLSRYRALSTPIIGVDFRETDGRCVLGYFDSLDLDEDLFRFVLDFQLGIGVTLLQDQNGEGFAVDAVRVSYPESTDTREREGLFEAPIEFGCGENALVWDARWLDRPQPYANSLTSMLVRETCERMLAGVRTESGTAGLVARMLVEEPGRFPGIEELAERMHITSRTLRRKLQAEGASYAGILASVRKELAIRHLRTTRMKVDEIAETLGFADVASFRQAFRKWTGRSPSDYRGRARAVRGGPDATLALQPDEQSR